MNEKEQVAALKACLDESEILKRGTSPQILGALQIKATALLGLQMARIARQLERGTTTIEAFVREP